MKKLFSVLSFLVLSLFSVTAVAEIEAQTINWEQTSSVLLEFDVDVPQTKPDGGSWDKPSFLDRKGLPDLFVELWSSTSEKMSDNMGLGKVSKGCINSFHCKVKLITTDKKFGFVVADYEPLNYNNPTEIIDTKK